jgi:hypothetical protein
MPLIWRLQFHKILLNFNDGIGFGQDNGILANTKIMNVECRYVECDMLICGTWYVDVDMVIGLKMWMFLSIFC